MKSTKREKFVAYYRVSTKQQGSSGLGLDAQKEMIYKKFGKENLVAEFIEIESGRKIKRVELDNAIATAKEKGVKLAIAKLDRLSRSVKFLFALKESGINFEVCDLPDLNTINLGIFASLAQYEAELISERTKAALQAKKARGFKLGNPENLTDISRQKSIEARKQLAKEQEANRKSYPIIKDFLGKISLRAIARKLNEYGLKTVKGKSYTAVQVQQILRLYQD